MGGWEKLRKLSSRIGGEDTIYIEDKLDKVIKTLIENNAKLEEKLDKIIQILEFKKLQEKSK